ncbi:MAG: DUF4328 domain-containing protein [Hyphomonas sp.]
MTELAVEQGHAATRPLRERFRPMRIAVLIYMIGEGGLALSNGVEAYFLSAHGLDPFEDLGMSSGVFALAVVAVGLMQLGGLFASVVLVAMWTFRAMKNLHIVGAPGVSMTPGWAVGWYFIPIANLWKPFEGMLQIWRESHRLAGRPEKVAAYVGWWWACWIGGGILSQISLRLTGFIEPLPTYEAGLAVAVIAGLVSVAGGYLLLRTTSQVTAMQAEMRVGGLADTFS